MTLHKRIRDWMEIPARFPCGGRNSIADVKGVLVGHHTIINDPVCTGVTIIKPHALDPYCYPTPCAVHAGNGFGKLAGSLQVQELGCIESLIGLTNTLSVAQVLQGIIEYQACRLSERDWSMNVLVGETNDGALNDIRGLHIKPEHVHAAIAALSPHVGEGCVGAGAGTCCFGFKGGIGTASRVVAGTNIGEREDYTIGALLQTNFGGNLNIYGGRLPLEPPAQRPMPGSCMIVVATDAPLDARQLSRIAKRSMIGITNTGSYLSHSSGDFCIAFSNCARNLADRHDEHARAYSRLSDEQLDPLFEATVEAVQEAVYNSLTMASDTTSNGKTVEAFDITRYAGVVKLK